MRGNAQQFKQRSDRTSAELEQADRRVNAATHAEQALQSQLDQQGVSDDDSSVVTNGMARGRTDCLVLPTRVQGATKPKTAGAFARTVAGLDATRLEADVPRAAEAVEGVTGM